MFDSIKIRLQFAFKTYVAILAEGIRGAVWAAPLLLCQRAMRVIVRTVEDLRTLWERIAAPSIELTKDEAAAAAKLTESLKIFMESEEVEFVEGAGDIPMLDLYGADGTAIKSYEWYTCSTTYGGNTVRKRKQTREYLVQCRWTRCTGDDGIPRAHCVLK